MGCNWELYEFRVVFDNDPRFGGPWRFINVIPEPFGLKSFEARNGVCDFRSVFQRFVFLRYFRVSCLRTTENEKARSLAERNWKGSPITPRQEFWKYAKLYVHRRDAQSQLHGIAVHLDAPTIYDYAASGGKYYVTFSTNEAKWARIVNG